MALYRGFKSHATRLANKVRADLDLQSLDAFVPHEAADRLGISVCALSDYVGILSDDHLDTLHHSGIFSAATVFRNDGVTRRIIFNDAHSPQRIMSDLSHELAHALLAHRPRIVVDLVTGCRSVDRDEEEQAAYLSGALLVTDQAALVALMPGIGFADVAARLGVSLEMLQYRVNVSGARRRVAARRRFLTSGPTQARA